MVEYFQRTAVGPEAAGTQSAIIKFGDGVYEIVYIHLMVGASVPVVGARFFIGGQVHFQRRDEQDESTFDMKRAQRVMPHANFTDYRPYVSYERVIIRGEGRLKSFVEFPIGYAAEHTMTVIYRRLDY